MKTEQTFFVIIGVLFILITSITVSFALATLIIIIRYWHPRCRSVANLLISNTCVSLLFFGTSVFVLIPPLFQTGRPLDYVASKEFCRFRGVFFLITCIVKLASYMIKAISRYFITVLHRRRNLTTFRTNWTMIVISWIFSIALGSSILVSPIAIQYEPESRLCVLTSKVFETSFTLMSIAFLPTVNVIVVLYGIILWHTTRTNLVQPNYAAKWNNRRNIKVFQNILLLILVVIVGGIPYLLAIIINKFSVIPWPWYSISILFIDLASAAEALVLFFTTKDVQGIVQLKLQVFRTNRSPIMTIQRLLQGQTLTTGTNQIQPTSTQRRKY